MPCVDTAKTVPTQGTKLIAPEVGSHARLMVRASAAGGADAVRTGCGVTGALSHRPTKLVISSVLMQPQQSV